MRREFPQPQMRHLTGESSTIHGPLAGADSPTKYFSPSASSYTANEALVQLAMFA